MTGSPSLGGVGEAFLKIMKILVLNCGSSSIKYKLFEMDTQSVLAQGGIEKIGLPGSFLKFTLPNGEKVVLEKDIQEHTAGVEFILQTLTGAEYGAIKSLDELDAVGHRMVHGGEKFSQSVLLNEEVLAAFEACNDLAPLHNPPVATTEKAWLRASNPFIPHA